FRGPFNIEIESFSLLERMHRPALFLKILKFILLVPCFIIWGRKRGPRAARRCLFEISWRVFGRKTYTVSGWPGRIFYKES
ncbi:MAG: hypothetical protein ABIG11_08090, partial [bacterium]